MADPVVLELAPKRTGETVSYSVDFTNLLASGETLSSATNWAISVKSGTDASPSSVRSGSASVSGTKAVQLLTGGVDGVTYWVLAEVVTSASQTLQQLCTLKVEDAES